MLHHHVPPSSSFSIVTALAGSWVDVMELRCEDLKEKVDRSGLHSDKNCLEREMETVHKNRFLQPWFLCFTTLLVAPQNGMMGCRRLCDQLAIAVDSSKTEGMAWNGILKQL